MIDSKLIILLKTFKKTEWRRFKAFLDSPYYNKRSDLLPFFQYIAATSPDFSAKKLEKKIVFKKIYPSKPYEDKQMRYLMNYTLEAAEQFLGQQKMQAVSMLDNYILEELVDRKLEKHAKKYFEKITEKYDAVEIKPIDYYFSKYKLADIANKHISNQGLRKDDINLKLASDNLDLFYLTKKLKYSCEMLNRQRVFLTNYDLNFTNLVYDYLLGREDELEPLNAIYCEIYAMLTKEDASENYEHLKELMTKHTKELPEIEKKNFYSYSINFCSQQIRYGNKVKYYANECLDLYLEGIQEEVLLDNGFLSPWNFKNVVKLGFNLKKYDWTEQFIQDYYLRLAPEFQSDALHYNLADLAYQRKNYSDAQYHLLLVEYSDIFYTLDSKVMLLKIYFEDGEFEPLFSLIASFSIYLRRNKKISNNFRITYLNFTSLLHQIVRATKDKIPKVVEKINQTESLTSRVWLLDICKEVR